jgi:hypothetical protein
MRPPLFIVSFGVICGACGLITNLLHELMLEAINRHRSVDRHFQPWNIDFWSIRREFRKDYPNSRLYFWDNVVLIVSLAVGGIGLLTIFFTGF